MHIHSGLFIGGSWVSSTSHDVLEVISPHSETVVGRVPAANEEDVDRAVGAARTAFDTGDWPGSSPAQRAEALTALAVQHEAHIDEFAALITEQMVAPISYTRFGQPTPCASPTTRDMGSRARDVERGTAIARRIRSGSVGINQYMPDLAAPLGGFKDSGFGREGGPEGIDQYVELQSLLPGIRL